MSDTTSTGPVTTGPVTTGPGTTGPVTTGPAATGPGTTALYPRPRIRAAAITWGLIVAAIASVTLWVITSPARREGFVDWVLALTPGDVTLLALAASGAIVLVAGLLSAVRSVQTRSR